ncbi:MAG: hypothetical protein HQK99_12835 [Nitrospirae bacterium]|nr:hypothetical protein [Nitrospirota bacterium]
MKDKERSSKKQSDDKEASGLSWPSSDISDDYYSGCNVVEMDIFRKKHASREDLHEMAVLKAYLDHAKKLKW